MGESFCDPDRNHAELLQVRMQCRGTMHTGLSRGVQPPCPPLMLAEPALKSSLPWMHA